MNTKTRKIVGTWLIIGLVMVFVQVMLGGITRLTDSGLSITEWNVIKGVLPPLNDTDWQIAFDKYKNMANQQYKVLHADMTLPKFKKIYFWEWLHRLWARTMGFVFLFPFIFFLVKKYIPNCLLKRLAIVIVLAILVASLGWIMVLSGFDSKTRTWVSAYKLSLHLGVAAWLFAYLFKTYLHVSIEKTYDFDIKKHYTFSKIVLITVFIQILLGGLMAGMHAGIIHAHFPFFMGENSLVNTLLANTNFSKNTFLDYEKNNFIKALVQVFHRGFAWFILVLTIIFSYTLLKKNISKKLTIAVYLLIVVILI